MVLARKEHCIVAGEEALCKKCNKNKSRNYHSWCADCYNEYRNSRSVIDKEEGKGNYLYYIVNTATGIICYTGKSNSIVIRQKCHLEWLTSNFGKMLRATGSNPSNYQMYVMDLSELKINEAELRALEHQNNYVHRDTVFNADIKVTTKDIDILEDLRYRGVLDQIDTMEWVEYSEFIHKKKTFQAIKPESTL